MTFFGFFYMCDLGVSLHFTSKKNTESSIIFLQNGVLILNWKENKDLIWDKDSKEIEQVIITESPINKLWNLFYYGKKNIFWFLNNFKYISSPRNRAIVCEQKNTTNLSIL